MQNQGKILSRLAIGERAVFEDRILLRAYDLDPPQDSHFDELIPMLLEEYRAINQRCQVHLREPKRIYVFESFTDDEKEKIGFWNDDTREMGFSTTLFGGAFLWREIQQVIRHEMAHQYACEKLKDVSNGDPHYTSAYKRACELLGVSPANQSPLEQRAKPAPGETFFKPNVCGKMELIASPFEREYHARNGTKLRVGQTVAVEVDRSDPLKLELSKLLGKYLVFKEPGTTASLSFQDRLLIGWAIMSGKFF